MKNIISFLGNDTEFNGALTFDGDIRMDGRFKGEIKGGVSLIIGEAGVLEAEINVPYVIIMGEVKGNIFSEKKVFILSKGKVYGDIKSPNLVIEDGGLFNGRSLMKDIDRAPFPSRYLLDNSLYYSILSKKRNYTAMITSRGCPFRCLFCSVRGEMRLRSPENVLDEAFHVFSH